MIGNFFHGSAGSKCIEVIINKQERAKQPGTQQRFFSVAHILQHIISKGQHTTAANHQINQCTIQTAHHYHPNH